LRRAPPQRAYRSRTLRDVGDLHVTLWRASDNTRDYASGSCFAADEEDAERYLDNPGFGGAHLFSIDIVVPRDRVLSLVDGRRNGIPYGLNARDAWRTVAEALGLDSDDSDVILDLIERSETYIHGVFDSPRNRAKIHANGYDWAVYQDSWPDGMVTWVYLGERTQIDG
jgi:hypothetical protein